VHANSPETNYLGPPELCVGHRPCSTFPHSRSWIIRLVYWFF